VLGSRFRALAVLAAAGVCLALATSAGARPETTQPDTWQNITVTLRNASVTLSENQVERGTFVAFAVKNSGRIARTFVLGGAHEKLVRPRETYRFELYFDVRGEYPYESTSPKRGAKVLKGVFRVV
jgi:hypothetical protein